jgi:hypothetical protein
MRYITFTLFMIASFGLFGMTGASAAPAGALALSNTATHSDLIHVSGGCGPHRHRGPHGHCRND